MQNWDTARRSLPACWRTRYSRPDSGWFYEPNHPYDQLVWESSGTGTFDNPTILNPTYTPSDEDILNGGVVLTVFLYAYQGCDNLSDNLTLDILRVPAVYAGQDDEICEGLPYPVNGADVQFASEILWTTDGQGTLINPAELEPTYLPAPGETGMISFTLRASNNVCPPSFDTRTLLIAPKATVQAGPDGTNCGTEPYQVLGASVTNYSGLLWSSSGSGTFDDVTILEPTYTPSIEDVQSGFVLLTLHVEAINSCPDTTDQRVLTLVQPALASAGNDETVCEGTSHTISTAYAQNYESLLWTTKDGLGTILDPQTLTPTYVPYPGEIGTVHLTLTVDAFDPCEDVIDEMALSFSGAPEAQAGNNGEICQGSTFDIFGWASNYKSFWWVTSGTGSFENGNSLEPTYIPAPGETGLITITLFVEGFEGCDTITDVIDLQIVPAVAAFAGPDHVICENATFDITEANAINYANVEWITTGLGTLDNPTTLSPSYTPAIGETGEIMFILVAFAFDPCPDVLDTLLLTINPAVQASAGGDDAICQGDSYHLINASIHNFESVTWSSSGDGSFDDPAQANPTYYPGNNDIENGFVVLTAFVKGIEPCGDVTVSMRLGILSNPTAFAGLDASICEGDAYTVFGAEVSNNVGISWSTSGDGIFSDTAVINPVYTPGPIDIASGNAILTLTAMGAGSCSDSFDNLVLTIIPSPDVYAGPDQFIDHFTTTELNGSASGGSGSYSYQWDPENLLADPDEQNPTTKIITDTTLFILLVTDLNSGCQGTDSVMVFPSAPNNPPLAIGELDTTNVNIPITIVINGNDSDPDNDDLTYYPCDDPGPKNGTVIFNGDGTITYTPFEGFVGVDSVCYRVCDDGIPSYCEVAYAVIVVVPEEDCLRIYNGITPNGDGINDTWQIDCIDMFSENEVYIFNRWGDIVRHMFNYDNKNVFWDGSNEKKERLPDGTYYFVLKLKAGDIEKVYTGWVFVHGTEY